MLKIMILGCGSSHGVPVIGCRCKVCRSDSSYNKRRRSSILIENNKTKILVDFGFDIKDQLLDANISSLDAAILTHDHADHVAGIDNLRVFKYLSGKALPIYMDVNTAKSVRERYRYMIEADEIQIIDYNPYDLVNIADIPVQFFLQDHGRIDSLGIRIENFVYSPDVRDFYDESIHYLNNIDTWVLDCLGYKSNHAHAGLERVLEWNEMFRPKKIYLTNMRDEIDYFDIQQELPENIRPCYDGMKIVF